MAEHLFYCAKCWQEFDRISDHGTGSWHGRQRLDVPCCGDIRRTRYTAKPSGSAVPSGDLALDSGEPLKIV